MRVVTVLMQQKLDAKKFCYGNPEYLEMLIELFQGVAVDGTSAYFPRDGEEEGFVQPAGEGFAADNGFEKSPMSSNSRKRGSSTCEQSIASSPGKKSKRPVVKLMKGLLNSFSTGSEKSNQLMTEIINKIGKPREKRPSSVVEELTQYQKLAIDCGATEEIVDYFCATQFFAEKHNRVMFMK